jgi:DNA-binding transcriptional ArsR family regulator
LTYSYIGIYCQGMARAATTADVFNAIAEPWRRRIIDTLVDGREHPVGHIVDTLGISQPAVSKHLGVLRKVGLVCVTKQGQLRLYRLNPAQLQPVHEWLKTFEHFWSHQLDRVKERAEQKMRDRANKEKSC